MTNENNPNDPHPHPPGQQTLTGLNERIQELSQLVQLFMASHGLQPPSPTITNVVIRVIITLITAIFGSLVANQFDFNFPVAPLIIILAIFILFISLCQEFTEQLVHLFAGVFCGILLVIAVVWLAINMGWIGQLNREDVAEITTIVQANFANVAGEICPPLPELEWDSWQPINNENSDVLQKVTEPIYVPQRPIAATFSADQNFLAVVTRRSVCIYDLNAKTAYPQPFATDVTQATFSHDSRFLAVGNEDGTVGIWDVNHNQLHVRWTLKEAHQSEIKSLVFNSSGEWLVSASQDGSIYAWEVLRTEEQFLLHSHPAGVNALVFLDRNRLLLADQNGQVGLLQLEPRQNNGTVSFYDDNQEITVLEYQTGEGWLGTVKDEDAVILVWKNADSMWLDGDPDHTSSIRLRGHTNEVTSLTFAANSSLMASGGKDNDVYVWDVEDQTLLNKLEHNASIQAVAFSPNGRLLISVSSDDFVHLWGVPNLDLEE